MNKVKIEREEFEYKGRNCFGYFLKGNVYGKDVKIGIKPPDGGGYTVLDIFFELGIEPVLTVSPYELTTDEGEVISGKTYAVEAGDAETGEVFSCKVLPARASDKTLLAMTFR